MNSNSSNNNNDNSDDDYSDDEMSEQGGVIDDTRAKEQGHSLNRPLHRGGLGRMG